MVVNLFFDVYVFTPDKKIVHSINLSDNGNVYQLLYEGKIYEINGVLLFAKAGNHKVQFASGAWISINLYLVVSFVRILIFSNFAYLTKTPLKVLHRTVEVAFLIWLVQTKMTIILS